AQAGVFFFDGRPIDRERVVLAASLRPFAPDGIFIASSSGIVLAHGAFDVWTGDRLHGQPRRSESGLVMTWDGRVDNRSELLCRLGRRATDASADDALALAIFERDGVDGLRALIGDWSLVIWDSRRRTLLLARDYMGVSPLYYYRDDRAVMWSSHLGELA